jgi:hypothetical protein
MKEEITLLRSQDGAAAESSDISMTEWQVITRMTRNAQEADLYGTDFFVCLWISYVRLKQASKAVIL